jgi:hypothetical protein
MKVKVLRFKLQFWNRVNRVENNSCVVAPISIAQATGNHFFNDTHLIISYESGLVAFASINSFSPTRLMLARKLAWRFITNRNQIDISYHVV